ncbi:MAG: T9SS type A sorting domain-containing protein [candidate division Zixibacteria bacterium]|nr:T9SS type A sorting domain-containing protein [candidate division Zixibacteria bacterium]
MSVNRLFVLIFLLAVFCLPPFYLTYAEILSGTGLNYSSATTAELLNPINKSFDNSLPDKQKKTAGLILERVGKQDYFDTPRGHFRVHYDTTGDHAVYQAGIDENPADGHPDYVNRCGDYLEDAWSLFDSLGFTPPPDDGYSGGGDNLYDVYMHHNSGLYGVTYPDGRSYQYPGRNNSYKSYMHIDADFEGMGYPDRTVPLKITSVHEYFHAIQFGYNLFADSWFMECCASWAEDVLYDEINDNYRFLPFFFNYPHKSHRLVNSGRENGLFVWLKYLEANYGIQSVGEIWELNTNRNTDEAIDLYFQQNHGSLFRDVYRDFELWNYFTGSRDDGGHYEEGSNYPLVHIMQNHRDYPVNLRECDDWIAGLGCTYTKFGELSEFRGELRFELFSESNLEWALDAIIFESEGETRYESSLSNTQGYGVISIDLSTPVDNAVICVTLLNTTGPVGYTYSAFIDDTTGVKDGDKPQIPTLLSLGNYPNPFNGRTNIRFQLARTDFIELAIYNLKGEIVEKIGRVYPAGHNSVNWRPRNIPSGLYYYKISASSVSGRGKMLFLK